MHNTIEQGVKIDPSSMVHEQGQQQCCLLQIMQPTSRLQTAPSLGVHETNLQTCTTQKLGLAS